LRLELSLEAVSGLRLKGVSGLRVAATGLNQL